MVARWQTSVDVAHRRIKHRNLPCLPDYRVSRRISKSAAFGELDVTFRQHRAAAAPDTHEESGG
jgi:hypothetical protein